jgi:kynurenine formamidase
MPGPSNWGRWGADDERGTLNLLAPDQVVGAAAVVKKGKVYSLGLDLSPDAPRTPGRNALWHRATRTERPGPAMSGADDLILMHTHTATHLDALCHVWVDRQLYNGFPSSEIGHDGAKRNGVHNVRSIVARGLLLDVAGHRGVDHLEPGELITATELDAVAKDNAAVEVLPPEDGVQMALHIGVIRDLGGYLIEYLDLEELAADRAHEFLFVLAPLRLVQGIGSPVNPIAIT